MRILILADRFVPEITAVSVREMEHAQEWLKMGHEVTVVTCAPNFPHGKVFAGYKNRVYQEEWIDGVRVIRVWSYMAENVGTMKRTLDYISFAVSAIFFFWRYPKFDIILATSPPLFVAVAGYGLSVLRRRPWVFEIRDLWPATIEAVGASKGRMLKLLTRLEEFLYRKATRLISVTAAFKQELAARGFPPEKNDVVTNGVNTDKFNERNVLFDARERLGVGKDKFLAGFIGTVGLCQGLAPMLDSAEQCRDNPNIVLLIMGEGAERPGLEEEARRRGLTNLLFHDFVPHEEVCSYIAALDASIVHLRPHALFKTVIPSKIFENMAMGTPMIYAVEGHSAEIVTEAGAGVCIPSGDGAAMAEAIKSLARDRDKLRRMSESGKAAAAAKYTRRVKAQEIIRSLNRALGRPENEGVDIRDDAEICPQNVQTCGEGKP